MPDGPTADVDPEIRRHGYKESFVQEYDGIKEYHHQGRYQHLGPQIYSWAFYEYRMVINSECWNIIIDENMKEVPSNFPGSSSAKLTHDFCHVDSDNSDDVYTNFSFVEMGVAQSGLLDNRVLPGRPMDLGQPEKICCHLRPSAQ